MTKLFKDIFTAVGLQYEALICERRLRDRSLQDRGAVIRLNGVEPRPPTDDDRLERKIQLIEIILTALAELKNL